MAGRTALPVISMSRFQTLSFSVSIAADVANGNVTPNDGFTFFAAFNADGSNPHNLTVNLANGLDGLPAGPRPYVIPVSGTGTVFFGPWPIQFYSSQLLWNADNANVKVQPVSLLGP
jgi:hypothetical protein